MKEEWDANWLAVTRVCDMVEGRSIAKQTTTHSYLSIHNPATETNIICFKNLHDTTQNFPGPPDLLFSCVTVRNVQKSVFSI